LHRHHSVYATSRSRFQCHNREIARGVDFSVQAATSLKAGPDADSKMFLILIGYM
jgi:hypothetical protein